MDNINNLDSPNKYMLGSIWKWRNNGEQKAGVQSGDRPVLIISNNSFNSFSPVVNCVTITSQLRESPVHVPIHITVDSHIQCEQVHTISKTELVDFIGIVPNSTISSVKAKLRLQFDMSTDRTTELFNTIRKSIEDLNTNPEIMNSINENLIKLNEKADKGFGVPDIENDFLKLVLNLENSIEKIVSIVEKLKSASGEEAPLKEAAEITEVVIKEEAPGDDNIPGTGKQERKRGQRRHYTYADKVYIADKNTPIKNLMEKYGYDRITAHKMRAYFKKRIADGVDIEDEAEQELVSPGNITNISSSAPADTLEKSKKTYRRYTDEDRKFILDTNNSIESIMEKYGYKKRQDVYWTRARLKKIMPETE